jgi:hypothetical protein
MIWQSSMGSWNDIESTGIESDVLGFSGHSRLVVKPFHITFNVVSSSLLTTDYVTS